MTEFALVANNGYSVQDNPEPEAWVRPMVAAGLHHLEFFSDHLEPVIFENVIRKKSRLLRDTLKAIESHNIKIVSVTTGKISYLLNVLAHPYDDARTEGIRWCERLVDLAVALGAPCIGGHFDYISETDANHRTDEAKKRAMDGMVQVADYAAKQGLKSILLEQMHGPRLLPYTVREAREMLQDLNRRAALPFYLMADTGHMMHVSPDDPNHTDEDKDPYHWLAQQYLNPPEPDELILVHAQQTDRRASRHWPFTDRYDNAGLISPEKIVGALQESRVKKAYLSFEILYDRGVPISVIEKDLVETASRFRSALQKAGYKETESIYTKGVCSK